MTAKRIIVITTDDPNDVSSWSGTRYSIHRGLADNTEGVEIVFVRGALPLFSLAARIVNRIARQLGITLRCHFSTAYAMLVGMYLTVHLKLSPSGALLFIAGSNELAYLKTDRRVIYISDATFRAIAPLYPHFRALPKWLQKQGDRNESRSLARAEHILYPAEWAAESAKRDYGVPSDRIVVLPFGPNIPDELIHFSPKSLDPGSDINILFVGVDWVRKSGDLVLEACRFLSASGLKPRLLIVGDVPEHARKCSFVQALGPLRKSESSDVAILCNSYSRSHFLLLPSIADAFGVVFVEAQAFGVPQIAFDVGGVGSAVIHDETGLLLPAGSTAEQFAKEIRRCVDDPALYARLSRGAREHYEKHANWRNWSRLILELASR